MTIEHKDPRSRKPNGAGAEPGPCCFMHIPKSGGVSIHTALEFALPSNYLAPQRFDTSIFCDFNEFDSLCPETRAEIVVTENEKKLLAAYPAVSGHFSLPTLNQITDPSSIVTILREPRTRLISLYIYWRIPEIYERWNPYRVDMHALRPLAEFLSEPRLAAVTDNQVCRMLLHGDSRVPSTSFIANSDIENVALDAIKRLSTIGFVGLLELGDSAWRGVARLFGVKIDPIETNVAGEGPSPIRARYGEKFITANAFDLIEDRNAADLIVYEHALTLAGLDSDERRRLKDRVFAQQLVKLGDLIGSSFLSTS
ncbi:MAG: hypothetical protein WAU42_06875 [Solirubrobacteraceae bacterium]